LPSHKAGASGVSLGNGQTGASLDIQDRGREGCTLAPDLELPAYTPCQQSPAGVEFWVAATINEDRASVGDAVAVAALAERGGLDDKALPMLVSCSCAAGHADSHDDPSFPGRRPPVGPSV